MEGVLASAVDLLWDNQVDAMLGALSVNTPRSRDALRRSQS
jgi:hypothetical protein